MLFTSPFFIGFALVWWGKYPLVEKVMALFVGIMFVTMVGAALLAVLHLGEVALEEVDLVLALGGGGVGGGVLHGEVVEDLAFIDGGASLRDQLGAEHGLAVP